MSLRIIRQVAGLLFCLAVFFSMYGAQSAEAALISTKEEISIGKNVAKDLEKKYGLVEDKQLQERVARIGARLVAVSDRRDIEYSFKVLNSKDINALAVPGGFIYVFKGLVDYMPSDEELAGVIGHEVGHIVKRHTVRQMEKSLVTQVVFGVLFGDRGVFLQNLAYNAIMAGYSREDESQADELGFRHTYLAGYNPYSMLLAMHKLDDLDKKGGFSVFSTHPEPGLRVSAALRNVENAQIRPGVSSDGKTAEVVDGSWKLPAFTVNANGYKPLYRAYFTAGALYLVSKQADLRSDHFYVYNEEGNSIIYYDDYKVVTLTEQDATTAGVSLNELTEGYMLKLREWVENKKQKAAS